VNSWYKTDLSTPPNLDFCLSSSKNKTKNKTQTNDPRNYKLHMDKLNISKTSNFRTQSILAH